MERSLKEIALAIVSITIASIVGVVIDIMTADRRLSIEVGITLLLVLLVILEYFIFSSDKEAIGLKKVFKKFDNAPPTLDLLKKAKTHFCFLGISARSFFEFEDLEDILQKKAREGCKFEFLLLDPNSEFLELKAKDENDDPIAWKSDIRAGIERLVSIGERLGTEKLDIRTYNAFPIWRGIFIDENEAYISYYPHGHRGKYSPIISVKNKDISLYDPFRDFFRELWEGRIAK